MFISCNMLHLINLQLVKRGVYCTPLISKCMTGTDPASCGTTMWSSEILPYKFSQEHSLHLCRKFSSEKRVLPQLTLYSKSSGCSLCDQAKEDLLPYKHRIEVIEVDITLAENKSWHEKYCFDIPVIYLNGMYLMRHRVDTKLLKRKLDELDKKNSS